MKLAPSTTESFLALPRGLHYPDATERLDCAMV